MRTTSTRTCVRPLPKYASRRSNKQPRRIISKKTGHGRDEPRPWRSQSGYEVAVSALRGAESIEPLLLLVAKRCIKLLERGLHGLHRVQHGVEPLLHRLQTANRRERAVGRAVRAQQIGSLSGGVLQVVQRAALRIVGPHRPFDALRWQPGNPGGARAADLRQIALRLLLIGIVGAERVEARLLLVVERVEKFLEDGPHGAH